MPGRGHVAGYWAVDGEIGLHAWQLRLPASLVYCLPVLHGDRLRFAPWRPGGALRSNRYGIPEPDIAAGDLIAAEDMALVVAPLVAFDSRCHRIGMGAGWYDRSFAFRRDAAAPPWLVGAAFAAQQVDAIAPEQGIVHVVGPELSSLLELECLDGLRSGRGLAGGVWVVEVPGELDGLRADDDRHAQASRTSLMTCFIRV